MDVGNEEIYRRLNTCEKDIHLLKHRTEVLESERLAHRVLSLEDGVQQVRKDVGKIEVKVCEISERLELGMAELKDEVTAMRSTVRGVVIAAGGFVVFLQLIPTVLEVYKWAAA